MFIKIYIHIHYPLYLLFIISFTYYIIFALILFENDNNVTKWLVLELQFPNWYWFPFPIIFLNKQKNE